MNVVSRFEHTITMPLNYVACDNLFKYSNNAAQFFILAVLWSRFKISIFYNASI